jgi:hypothetical protein
MDKQDAIKIIVECANKYKNNLENKNLMFVTQINKNQFKYIEILYLGSYFLHLTGFTIKGNLTANTFYDKCLKKKLSPNDFEFKDDGTTMLKLDILSSLMDIHKNAKMIGGFNGTKPKLICDKLVGGEKACMSLRMTENYFVPVSSLKEDIRDLIINKERVIAIFRKPIKTKLYDNLTYVVKEYKEYNLFNKFPIALIKKINISNLICESNIILKEMPCIDTLNETAAALQPLI